MQIVEYKTPVLVNIYFAYKNYNVKPEMCKAVMVILP